MIKCYNLVSKSFHQRDKSIFFSLGKETFIEVFDLGGPMTLLIDIDDLTKNFKKHKNFYMGREITRHIPQFHKEKEEIPKKKEIEKIMPLEFF